MVYRGKPSPRCGRCRSRALKCSLEKPACAQCIRAKVDCPGYRDFRSLLIVDESENVSRKAEKRRTVKTPVQRGHRSSGMVPLPDQRLSFSIQEQASCFVYENYLRKWVWLYGDDVVRVDSLALSSAMAALGLSALANMRMSPPLMIAAREEYTKALAATNQNITDSVLSKTDETLVAVMFLGLFEVVTYNDPASIHRWMKHIQGAAKLLEWRGEDQLRNPRSLHLFRLMRTQILTHNIFEESYTSPILIRLSELCCSSGNSDAQYADRLAKINTQLSTLCADIRCGKIVEHAAIIGLALALDAEMEAWSASVPDEWRFETITLPAESIQTTGMSSIFGVYGTKYHVYKDLYSCGVWNNWRAARMVVHEIILNACSPQDDDSITESSSAQLFGNFKLAARSEALLRSITEEICASVPYHFGIFDHTQSSMEAVNINMTGEATVAGHLLIWPLFEAADSRIASPSLRIWAIMCLEKIGHGMGISQALAMADLLREGMGTRVWIKAFSFSDQL